jgi:hypothetical protein
MSNKVPLQQYCERLSKNQAKICCRVCLTTFMTTSQAIKFVMSDDDPILDELGNCALNDFVVNSCASQHGCDGKSHKLLKTVEGNTGGNANQPTADKFQLSDTHLSLMKTEDNLNGIMIDTNRKIAKCRGCLNELGHVSKSKVKFLSKTYSLF